VFFPLPDNFKAGFFQGSYGMQVLDAGKLGHLKQPLRFRVRPYP
jgi:hypothetical protein